MKRKNITLIIISILILISIYFVYKKYTTPVIISDTDNKIYNIDEHLVINEELRDVNFCGKNHKMKQVLVNGVDVGQRIAEIATKNLIPDTVKVNNKKLEICYEGYLKSLPIVNIEILKINTGYGLRLGNDSDGYSTYNIDSLDQIYYESGFDGSSYGPIGKLK